MAVAAATGCNNVRGVRSSYGILYHINHDYCKYTSTIFRKEVYFFMVVTEYPSLYSTDGKIIIYSWEQFCIKISRPVVSIGTTWERFHSLPKTSDNFEDETQQGIKAKAGGAVFGEMFTSDTVPPGRKKGNFPFRSAIALDYEHCDESIYERIHNALDGYTYAYHTTCKHQPPQDCRLHVIIPFADAIDWKLYILLALEFAKKIGMDGLDESCLRRSQMLLYCVHLRGTEYKYHTSEGKFLGINYLQDKYGTLDAEEIIKKSGIDVNNTELRFVNKKVKRKNKIKATEKVDCHNYVFCPDEPTPGDVRSCFNAVFSCRDILDMIPNYYIPAGDRYTYCKGSGSGGVWVSDDGTRCGSYHADSGDPLYGKSMTAFDVFLYYFCKTGTGYREKLRIAHRFCSEKRREEYEKIYYGLSGRNL